MYRKSCCRNDPRWIDVRYTARCACGRQIQPGDRGFYYPKAKTVACEKCGLVAEMGLIDDDLNQLLNVR